MVIFCDQSLVEKVLNEYRQMLIIHFAVESHVDRSIDGPKHLLYRPILMGLLHC